MLGLRRGRVPRRGEREFGVVFLASRVLRVSFVREVDETDGGLTRTRWERKSGQISRRAVGEIKRVPGTARNSIQQNPPSLSRSRWSIQDRVRTSQGSHLPVDGASSNSEEQENNIAPQGPVFYVSIFDPINDPSFKPSPTKPIPQWMQWLPSQRNRTRRYTETRPYSILDEYFPPPLIEASDYPTPRPPTIYPISPSPNPLRSEATPRPPNRRRKSQNLGFSNTIVSTITALKGPSFVLDEPLKRPSSRMAQQASTSPKPATGEFISPFPTDALLSPRSRTPYAPQQHSPLTIYEGKIRNKPAPKEASSHRAPSLLTEQVAAHLQRHAQRTPPAQSREFLNIYRPFQPSNLSVAVPGRRQDRGVGDGRRVRKILDRDRTPSPKGGARQVVTDTGEVVDVRTMRKKSSLQSEIKKFLSGRGLGRESKGE
ncbi:hypothetical protein F5Y11DRAFT_364698 [Daldinia sp. FL1419]|nr:hypothetical protein F5Y11DRAFT_364698 [Daldinia sp. FL1419]